MTDCSMISWWLAAWRALHFLACLLPVGLLAFHVFVAAPVLAAGSGPSRATSATIFISLIAALISGIAWLLIVAGSIGDVTPLEALRSGLVTDVLRQTHFGGAWRVRAVFWLVAVTASVLMFLRKRPSMTIAWICLIATAGLLGGLAWAGHGLDGDAATFHACADAVHLVVGGVWPFGLGPFAAALFMLRKSSPSRRAEAAAITVRFSALAVICVALLTVSGLINCWFMLPSVSSLWRSDYGRLLSVKIAAFAVMVFFAAVNRFVLKPRLSAGRDPAATTKRIARNVMIEFALGIAVILIVAVLGLLSPPMPM